MNPHSPPTHTGQPASEKSLDTKAFQSWRWGFLAAILLAAVAISTFYFSSAQAQGDDGAITGLTLTSDAPGTLTVSWDTASPTPTDYRVDWAKSTEGYKSWKVDEGHVYPTPDATTTTITDLDHDTEYKIRMRARYYKGEHMGKSWGGPWATATITVAGEPAETPTPEPVQEEESTTAAGTIDTLTATAAAGQLLLTWGPPAAPHADPTDYHVSWAKSTEDYPADTAEAGNDHPTTTTHTLAGLEYDSDYNVRVRARYTDGENADSPWNGPWTETTAQVRLPLPMAINITGAAVSPESQVFVFWSDPSNDSITGYQILRGPDAANLAVMEDDTGSRSTSYKDATPPAGQTHTYAVKARNPTGLSEPSNTVTATVPAAKKKEVLIVARHESNDDTLVSNLGQTLGLRGVIVGPAGSNQSASATSFTTGNNALGYHPTGAQLYLAREDLGTPTPQVSIREDNANLPSDTVLSSLTTSIAITGNDQLITFTTPDEVTLQPNTKYWLHVTTTIARASVLDTTSDNEDTQSQADWSIGDTGVTRENVETWATLADTRVLRMSILGHGISPESSDETHQDVSEPSGGDLADDVTTIGRLAVDGSVTGRSGPDFHDVDWFAFMAEADTYYQFTANPGRRNLPYYVLRIFDDVGTELQSSQIEPTGNSGGRDYYNAVDRRNNIAFRTHTAGTYYISIEVRNGNSTPIAYTLTMFGDDYSDDMNTMATVAVDASGRNFEDFQNYLMRTDASPESQTTDDVDWIRVALEAGATYEIVYDVACLHRSIIEGIYDSDGNRVFDTLERKEVHARSGITVNLCSNLVTKFTPSSDGDHYIAVSAKAPTVVTYRDGRLIYTNYPFQGVQGTLSVKVTSPPSTAATGNPLVRGERKVGATLTVDTARIADVSGLTNPMFNYQWQRMEDGMSEDIPGEVSETYTLTDDDVGKRVRLQVRFNDDEGTAEMRTGPATSVIVKAPHLLVGNINQNPVGHLQMPGETLPVQSTGFNTGAHDLGYVFDSATAYRGKATPVNDGDEIRIHGSTSEANAIDRRPSGLIPVVAASDFLRQNGLIVAYSARSRAKLDPSTTYHIFVATLDPNDEQHSCRSAEEEGLDSGSLPGFSINDRTYATNAATLSTISSVGNACAISIKGSELQSSNFLQDLGFTSSPAQEPMYVTGEVIEVTATLNQAVTFDGPPPVLLLQIGENQREMTYVASESTGSSWVFRYTVTADDRDDDGMSFNYFALQGYADADLSNNRVINDPEHLVNAVSQIVSRRVSSKPIAPMWYGPGEKIQFTLGFSLPVTVVGDPQLEFNVSTPDGPEFMSCESGSDTKELVFSYTVGTSDDDTDGIWWNATTLTLV